MASFPELGTDKLALWRLVGNDDNQLCCEVAADGDYLILTVETSDDAYVTREIHADIEPLVDRARELHDRCVASGWRPPKFDEELSP